MLGFDYTVAQNCILPTHMGPFVVYQAPTPTWQMRVAPELAVNELVARALASWKTHIEGDGYTDEAFCSAHDHAHFRCWLDLRPTATGFASGLIRADSHKTGAWVLNVSHLVARVPQA
jgi:hypothetical protein